jgi:hypothetical protein
MRGFAVVLSGLVAGCGGSDGGTTAGLEPIAALEVKQILMLTPTPSGQENARRVLRVCDRREYQHPLRAESAKSSSERRTRARTGILAAKRGQPASDRRDRVACAVDLWTPHSSPSGD